MPCLLFFPHSDTNVRVTTVGVRAVEHFSEYHSPVEALQ